jgi:hypothetical protein
VYYVKVNNYAGADERIATIQLATSNYGVLGTRERSLVGKGNDLVDVFFISVFKEENGEYVVRMY